MPCSASDIGHVTIAALDELETNVSFGQFLMFNPLMNARLR